MNQNPLLVLALLYTLSNQGKPVRNTKSIQIAKLNAPPTGPSYIDTFKIELLLDRLHSMTNTLEKVNHLNQMRNIPLNRNNSLDRIQESIDTVRGFIADNKASKKLDNISNTISGVKKFGDMKGLMSTISPILTMLASQNENNDEK